MRGQVKVWLRERGAGVRRTEGKGPRLVWPAAPMGRLWIQMWEPHCLIHRPGAEDALVTDGILIDWRLICRLQPANAQEPLGHRGSHLVWDKGHRTCALVSALPL